MFTGIVEEKGRVLAFTQESQAWRLQVSAGVTRCDVALGDSIAVNGCCLTVARIDTESLAFDVLEETRRLTNFSSLRPGDHVNLERSLRYDGRLGGHFVTGHVDGRGQIEVFEQRGADYYLRVKLPPDTGRYVVHKGSIAVDGVSLTIAEVSRECFAVWLIPTTLAVTNLGEKKAGAEVNLEFDLLGKYVERFAAFARPV